MRILLDKKLKSDFGTGDDNEQFKLHFIDKHTGN